MVQSIKPFLKSALVLLTFCICQSTFAQFDTQFWMPPIWNTGVSDHNSPSELYITTPFPNAVNVHIETADGVTFVFDGTVSSGSPLAVPLTPVLGQTDEPNVANTDRSLIVTSSQPVQCVHRISGVFNQTLVTLKGNNGRGRNFWCGSQTRNMNANYSPDEYHFISVMAMEDNTTITLETPFDMFQAGAGDLPNPYTITLNQFESYLIRGNNPIEHVAGSNVISDKDIIVNSGSTHTRIAGGGAADGGTDQIVPVGLMGTDFALVKGDNNNPFDYAIIVATEDNTQVFANGSATPNATLNAGEFFEWTLTGGVGAGNFLQADKTAYCYHFTGASQDDEVGMSAIPQLECTGSRYIEFSKFQVNASNQAMNLIAPPEALPTLTLNGVAYDAVPGVIISSIPGLPGWEAITYPEASLNDNNVVTSEGFFHTGFLTGSGGSTGTYGFLSGFNDAFEFEDPETGLPTTIYLLDTLCPGEAIDHCINVFSCSDDHNIINVDGNEGSVVVTPPSAPFDTCFRYTAPFDFVGYDTTTFTVDNRFGFEGSVDIVMLVVDPDTPINAGPLQELCSPDNSTTLSAIDPDPLVSGTWSVLSGDGAIVDPSSSTTVVNDLSLGDNLFLWTQDYGCESNTAITQVTVYDGTLPAADAGTDSELCSSTNTYTMQANDPGVTGTGTWEITQGNATINNINSPTAGVSNLGIGVNVFQWNLSNGPCPGGNTVDEMTILVYDQNAPDADAGPDQEFCSDSFSSTTLSANQPVVPASGLWEVVSGSGNFADSNNPGTTVTDLSIGENVFRWTIDNGPCGSTESTVIVTLFDSSLASVEAGPDAEYCSPVDSHTMSADPVALPANGIWTLVSGSGSIANLNNPNTDISNLGIGENVFRWTLDNGPCGGSSIFDEVVITIFDQNLPDANAGENQEFCSVLFSSANLNANSAPAPANGSWSVTAGSGTFSDINDPAATVSGLSIGDNTFRWTIDNGPCGSSFDELTIILFDNSVPTADAGPDAEYCTPTAQHTLSASSVTYPASGQWSVVSGSGIFADANDPNTTVSNLGVGANVLRWTVSNGVCPDAESLDDVSIIIFDASQAQADAGEDQEFCSSLFVSTNLEANTANFPASGEWTLISGSGTIDSPTDPQTSISGLSLGQNIFEWIIDNGPCGSPTSDQVIITLFDEDQDPANAGPDVEFCTPTSTYTMDASTAVAPAVGTWTLVQGTGTIADLNDPNTAISGLGIGENIFRWTIGNGACGGSENFDEISIFIFDENNLVADAGQDQELCWDPVAPVVTNLDASPVVFPASGEWSIVQGFGIIADPNDPNTTVSSLAIGENIFEWTVSNGPCDPSESSDQVLIDVFDPFQPLANAGPDQEICSSEASINLNANNPVAPSVGTWTVISGTGAFADPNDPNSSVSGYSIGLNTYRWSIDGGPCDNDSEDTFTLIVFDENAPVADAGTDQFVCSNEEPVQLDGSNSVFPGVGTWSVVAGSGTFSDPNDELATVSGLSVGENIFEWTIDNGPCPQGITTDQVSIFVFDENAPAADAGPDQELCTPQTNTNLDANTPVFPATGQWVVISGSGSFADDSDPGTFVTGLSLGDNVFEWQISNAPCIPEISTDQVVITVFDNTSPAANAGPDQEFCSPSSTAALSANTPTPPASGAWTLVSGSGTFTNPSNPNSSVTDLSIGENVFRWTIENGPCGIPTTDEVSIFIFDENQESANAGDDQILCTPTSSTFLTGNLAAFPASGLWELVSGTGSISDPSDPSTTVSGLSVGENVFRWNIFNGPCSPSTSEDLITITVFDSNADPANAGPDQELCTPTTNATMAANSPVFPGAGSWSLVSGSGSISDPQSPTTSISGLSVGVNVFEWTIDNGPCGSETTSDQVTILVFDETAPDANAGADQDLCTPQTSTLLNANAPVFPGSGQWVLVSGSGNFTDDSDPNTEVTGLSIGVNVFEWIISNGPCANAISTDQVSITLFDGGAPQAEAGSLQELCSPISSTSLNADPAVAPGTGTWTLSNGSGTISNPNDPNTNISDLSIGVNTFIWTLDYSTCGTQEDSVSVIVYDSNLAAADAGIDQSFCAPTNSTNFTASSVTEPAFGTWTVISGSGSIANVNDPVSSVNNLPVGENTFVWTVYNGDCSPEPTRTDTVSIFIFDSVQLPANAGEDIEICTPESTASLNGNTVIFPAIGEWTVVSGSGIITDPADPNTEVSGLSVGETILEWSIENGDCGVTTDQISVFVFDENNPAAQAGPDQEFCSPTSSATMAAETPTFPSTGVWTVVAGTGTFADSNDPVTEITDLSIGENVFRWTLNNGPCGNNSSDIVSVFIFDENAPDADAGEDQELCSPEDTTTLNANDATSPAQGSWTVVQGSGVFSNANSPSSQVSGLSIGENIFEWTINNGPCANGNTSDTVSIFVFDEDNAEANAGPDQALCSPDFETNLEADTPSFPAFGTWSLIQGSASITNVNDPNTSVTGLGLGQNIFRWTVYNGPCAQGETIDQVSIFIFDETAPDANAGPDQNLCTPQTSTTMEGSPLVFPATGQWEIVQGSGDIVNPGNPNTTVQNLGVGINILRWTVNNGPCDNGLTFDDVIINIFDNQAPTADAGSSQEFCLPIDSATLDANAVTGAAIGTWTLVFGSGDFADPSDPSTEVTGLSVGSNVFEWTIDNGVCGTTSDQTAVLIYDPDAPAAFAGDDVSFCTPTSTYQMNADAPAVPGVGTWGLVSGNGTIGGLNNPSANISGLTIGENVFSWTVFNGPCAEPTVDFVSIFIYDENHPEAFAGEDQELCLPDNSASLNADSPIFPAIGSWQVIEGSGTFIDVNDPNTDVNGLSAGINTFTWSIDNGPCNPPTLVDTISILVFEEDAPLADAGDDVSICSPLSTTTLDALDPQAPQSGTWTLTNGSGVISDLNDPNPIISGLEVGVNTFTWTIYNGPCEASESSDTVDILVYDANAPEAEAGEDQELCLPQNTTALTAQTPISPAIGTWTLVQGSGTILNVNDPTTTVTELGIGTNIFQWTVNNGPCEDAITTDSVSILVFEEDAPLADAGPDQQICTPLAEVQMDALDPTDPQSGTWALVSGGGSILDPNDPNTSIESLPVGVNVFSWTIDNGPCENESSIDLVEILVFDQNAPLADAGPDQELCLPGDSTVMAALTPISPATGTWTLIEGSGTISNVNDPLTAITELGLGTNTFVWSVDNGPCIEPLSQDTISIFIFEENALPADAGEDIEICTPESCAQLGASAPADPNVGTWSIISGNGSIDDINDPNAEICGLVVGETVLQWTVNNGPCDSSESIDTVTIRIFDENAQVAEAGNDQELCLPETTTVLQAEELDFPSSGEWTVLSGSGVFGDAADPNSIVSGLSVGVNEFLWSVYNGPCNEITTDTLAVTVFDSDSPNALVGFDQFFCSPETEATLSGNAPLPPALGEWSIISGSGEISDPNNQVATVSNLGLGENILIWQIYNGNCPNSQSTDTLSIFVNDAGVADANAGPDQFFCGEVDETQLEGSETVGNTATGIWTITEGGGDFANFENEFTFVSNIPLGVNTYVWTVDNLECGISSDTVSIFVYDPEIDEPFAGDGVEICENEFEPFELNAVEPDFPATGFWTVIEGPAQLSDELDPNAEVINLGTAPPLGSEVSVLAWNIDNGVCGVLSDTLSLSLDDCLTIEIPDAFSPNGDLINDFWEVPNLQSYPNNTVKIFNRWGALVHEASPYLNDWDGRSDHPSSIGEDLPVSTYYYILDLGDGTEPFTGYIYLKR